MQFVMMMKEEMSIALTGEVVIGHQKEAVIEEDPQVPTKERGVAPIMAVAQALVHTEERGVVLIMDVAQVLTEEREQAQIMPVGAARVLIEGRDLIMDGSLVVVPEKRGRVLTMAVIVIVAVAVVLLLEEIGLVLIMAMLQA